MPLYKRFIHDLAALLPDARPSGRALIAAVSGGPDSLCLLHLLGRAAPLLDLRLHVATLDHGLRGADGAADAAFVAALAARWGLPVEVGRADVPALSAQSGLGVEAAARRARYTFLAEAARRAGAALIATGHSADDQAETDPAAPPARHRAGRAGRDAPTHGPQRRSRAAGGPHPRRSVDRPPAAGLHPRRDRGLLRRARPPAAPGRHQRGDDSAPQPAAPRDPAAAGNGQSRPARDAGPHGARPRRRLRFLGRADGLPPGTTC